MTTTPEELQAKIAQIAGRYLDRVTREVGELQTMIDKAAGDMNVVRDIEALTHRMHGSGAMLQFDEVSDHAGAMEKMAAAFINSGQIDQPRMAAALGRLRDAVQKACAIRQQSAG